MNERAGSGEPVCVRLRVEGGENLRFMLDTGSDVSVLDVAWEPKLGRPVGKKHVGVSLYAIAGDLPVYTDQSLA